MSIFANSYNEFWFFVYLISFIFAAGIARHASKRGKTKLWGVVVFFTSVLGISLYAVSLASDSLKYQKENE